MLRWWRRTTTTTKQKEKKKEKEEKEQKENKEKEKKHKEEECDAPGFHYGYLTLMTESIKSNTWTLVKLRSTWVITMKP
jgi:hypothetical protein